MSSTIKPIKVFMHAAGPNPWKVILVAEELGLPYEMELIQDPKSAEFEKINPNGRLPAIIDPNTDITVWESGAILQYLAATYDKDNKISYAAASSPAQHWATAQFLHFQTSGQGPYFGQFTWFMRYHPEKVPSAVERYLKEVQRVTAVLEKALARTGTGYLVGDKATYADLAFLPWYWAPKENEALIIALGEANPLWKKWIDDLTARPAVKKTLEIRAEWMKQ